MTDRRTPSVHDRWANFRFAVVGPLLAAPPARGDLHTELERLAAAQWVHPITGEPTHFAVSTIERWFLTARKERLDPVGALRRKVRKDAGRQVSMVDVVRQALRSQYATHPSWSAQLHHQNLVALAEEQTELGTVPSYSTVRRFLKASGLVRRRRVTSKKTAGAERAEARLANFEVRSYEAEYVGGLLHWDFHEGSRSVLTPCGEWVVPQLFGALDDRSRVACHLQWYLTENSENNAHGLSQAFQKRGLSRAAMSDNGKAMTAAECTEALARLGITHETTLPYSPYQNAKQESFWGQVEGRLLAMLEDIEDLTLALLNEATQAWVEQEYNRSLHSEIGETPNSRWLAGPEVLRPSPNSEVLRLAFTRSENRMQRRSDGTVSLGGKRFEVPNRYRHFERVVVRYAAWDLSTVHMVDERAGTVLCRLYPQDKTKNASGMRRTLDPVSTEPLPDRPATRGMAPLLKKLMTQQAETGLPPAYIPKDEREDS